ncbi:hypothetical protein IWW50_004064 [Coemansia erecta]|nr:hypothetical protein GGF43_003160 [Coemansia sp. RSA 2618]KAJ2822787.1 hypothetical protein IWW50_004064 [Coemansia erecta]
MNATDILQPSLSPATASPGLSPLVRFRHSCEHCSGTRPVCDHCLRRTIPCVYKPQAKNPRRAASSHSPSPGNRAFSKRATGVQPISIPASNNTSFSPFFQPLQMADSRHSAPIHAASPLLPNNHIAQNASMQLRPASAIPPHLSNSNSSLASSSFNSGFMMQSPLAFGCSLPSDMGSTPNSFNSASMDSAGFSSHELNSPAGTPTMWPHSLGLENTPEISINGVAPADLGSIVDPLYNVHSLEPQTAPANSTTFDSMQQQMQQQPQPPQLQQHRRSMTNESSGSASNVPLIERSVMDMEISTDQSLFGFYPQQQQQMSFSMPSYSVPSMMSASNDSDSTLPFFKADDSMYMDLFSSFTAPHPQQQPQQQQQQQQQPVKQGSGAGIAPELTLCQEMDDSGK